MTITGKGNFTAQEGVTPEAGAELEPVTLVEMQGEVDGSNAHFSLKGLLTTFLGIDPANTFEVIHYEGDSFLKGPVPLLGAMEDKWYHSPCRGRQRRATTAHAQLVPRSFFGEAGIDPAAFELAGTETLDGQTCEVYSGDKEAVVSAFSKIGGATGATQQDLDTIDAAEFKFWVCPDGYLHQIKMGIEGHEQDKPEEKGSFEILMKISDFDSAITITPPADAEPLTLPTFGATPTP